MAKQNLIEIKVRSTIITIITLVKAFISCHLSYCRCLSPIYAKFKLFPLFNQLSDEYHWVWIIRLIDEIILLSAIFSILLVPCWCYYWAENRH